MSTLTAEDFAARGLTDWTMLFSAVHARFRTGDFATGLRFVDTIGDLADRADHHPEVTLAYPRVDVRLASHDVGGVSERDVRLAGQISEAAAAAGIAPDAAAVSVVELALDTPDHTRIKPFWRALLAYEDNPELDDEVRDADGMGPTLWFRSTDPHETPRQRFHLDIRMGLNEAERRIAAALDAGGTLVDDTNAPAFVVLADADGNRACVCTAFSRS